MEQRVRVLLTHIEDVDTSELIKAKIDSLLKGFDSFEDQLSSRNNPIAIDKGSGIPYRIIDERHRIFIARKKNDGFYTSYLYLT